MDMPKDPMMLLSFVNLKLRDFYSDLQAFCDDAGVSEEDIKERLAAIDYYYNESLNKFE